MQGSIGEKNNKTPKGCDFEGFDLIQPNKYGIVTGTPEVTRVTPMLATFLDVGYISYLP